MKAGEISRIHIENFNYAMSEGLDKLCERLLPCEMEAPEGTNPGFSLYKFSIKELKLMKPYITSSENDSREDPRLLPMECRLRGTTYCAPLKALVERQLDDGIAESFYVVLGNIPIMVKSDFCHLSSSSQDQLIKMGEDLQEIGGYFIINGIEKLIRLLIVPKQNYQISMTRGAFTQRGSLFTPLAVQVRSVRDDLFTQTVTLHYLSDGNCMVRFLMRRGEFLIPAIVLLRCLKDTTDHEIYTKLVRGSYEGRQISGRVEVLLRDARRYNVRRRIDALNFLGSKFRVILNLPSYMTDQQAAELLIQEHVLVHLDDFSDKFNFLLLMIEKLYMLAEGEIIPETSDQLSFQEFLLPGQLYLNIIKEKIEDMMDSVKQRLIKDCGKNATRLLDKTHLQRAMSQQDNLGRRLEYFLATGNLVSKTGLDLMQTSGFTIIAEKLNYSRYLSHFMSVHRGQYFTEMRISSVRKLLPECWGFLCPVHTPDGAPCGLLNHLSSSCQPLPIEEKFDESELIEKCVILGMKSIHGSEPNVVYSLDYVPVVLNGKLIGYTDRPDEFQTSLRVCKVYSEIPNTIEIAYLPGKPCYPGVFLFTHASRLIRPVLHLATGLTEYIGPLEQLNLLIACLHEDIRKGTTHQELSPLNMLSHLAAVTPFSDYNQSPRNMYQCQMAKQTMGTPMYNYMFRADNKTYRLNTPQKPLVVPMGEQYTEFGFEKYPSGTNAVVAVLAYTGYDMEDAMIINKGAYERGFGHGSIYKTSIKEYNEKDKQFRYIGPESVNKAKESELDSDGMPYIGTILKSGIPELCLFDTQKNETKVLNYKEAEQATLDDLKVIGEDNDKLHLVYKYRFNRNPIIGDKFSSRHGQKGVLSILWPQEDMPFTESGITPDVIINPHAFPSRMTIGMLIESMAGKSGSIHGRFQDARPFQRYYNDDIVGYFGEELKAAGYQYHGSELMYSGVFGTQLKAHIFIGVVYYQRLRHMVADKYQARATGPVDILTHQPVKGRKRHGGIRFGEMERDSILAHGAAFLLQDRLMRCSDYSEGYICKKCGSMLACYVEKGKENVTCKECTGETQKVAIPYVLRYLTNELAAMNIRVQFKASY